MSEHEHIIPTTDGPWWAYVDGTRLVLEVWPHVDHKVMRCNPRQHMPGVAPVEWAVDDERLVEGLDRCDTSDGEPIPSVEWIGPVALPEDVKKLGDDLDEVRLDLEQHAARVAELEANLAAVTAHRDRLREVVEPLAVIIENCENMYDVDDDETHMPTDDSDRIVDAIHHVDSALGISREQTGARAPTFGETAAALRALVRGDDPAVPVCLNPPSVDGVGPFTCREVIDDHSLWCSACTTGPTEAPATVAARGDS